MGVTIPVGFAQVQFVMRAPGATKNCTYALGLEEPTPTNMPLVLGLWADAVTDTGNYHAVGTMLNGYQLQALEATYMTGTGPVPYSYPVGVTGTTTGAPLPVNCSQLITKRTARGGRKGRGRIFMPPCLFEESAVDGFGNINPAFMAGLQTIITNTFNDLVATGTPPLLLHEGAEAPDEITVMTLQGQIATQRRRMR